MTKNTNTHTDWEREDILSQVVNIDKLLQEKWFTDWLKHHDKALLADARREVIGDLALKMKKLKIKAGQTNGNPIDGWKELKFVDIDDVLATLRKEEE